MGHFEKIAGALFAMVLAFASFQAQAATKAQDREFNHLTTGYPLTGVHATVACETCHVGGVFVGTPRACDGCHATGKRIVATPKSLKHIVTDAPCETCHFNTSTFYGARYNHGTAVPGQCTNCHNGRIVEGTPRNHPVSPVVGASCDSCHRSSSWLPASWNHTDTGSDCSVCHKSGGPGRNYTIATHLPMSMPPATFTGNCKACHTNYYTFLSAFYNHSGAGTQCQNCHGNGGGALAGAATYTGVRAAGSTGVQAVHVAIGAGNYLSLNCQSCHKSISTFLGATYDHSGVGTTCANCHASGSPTYNGYLQAVTSTAAHTVYGNVGLTNCTQCHKTTTAWAGSRYDHVGAGACDTCHTAANSPYIRAMSVNHIPFITPGTTCTNCHTSSTSWASVARGSTLHAYVTTTGAGACAVCHGSNTAYPGNGQETARWPSFHESSKNPSAADCSASGCHRPAGSKGVLYQRWD